MTQFILPVWFYWVLAQRHRPELLTTQRKAIMVFTGTARRALQLHACGRAVDSP